MVLVKRQVPPVQQLHKIKSDASKVPKEKVQQFTNQAQLAGVLTQLTLLTKYASEMFTGLLKETHSTYSRIAKLEERSLSLTSHLPTLDSYFSTQQSYATMTGSKL